MPRDTAMRAHERRYNFAQFGNSEQNMNQGKHLIRNNVADLWTPCYGDGFTVIRILPQRNLEDPSQWEPYRLSAGQNAFGDWIRRYPAVRSMGDPGVTFITADPTDPNVMDQQMTPGWILFNAISRAVQRAQDRPGWAAMLRGGHNRGAQLPRPSEVYLVQCAIMHYKTRTYGPPPKPFDSATPKPIIMELGPSAGLALLAELNRVREGQVGTTGSWEEIMAVGDPVNIAAGKFATFYKLADGDPRQQRQPGQAMPGGGWQAPLGLATQGPQPRQQEPIGHGCFLEDTFNGMSPGMSLVEESVRSLVLAWDDALFIPTIEQQAHLLADKFPPEVIEYAFSDYPEWIPEHVRRRARGSVTLPAATIPPAAGLPIQGAGPQGMAMPQGAPPPLTGWGPPSVQPAIPFAAAPPAAAPPVMAPPAVAAQGGWAAPSAQQGGWAAPPQAPMTPPPSVGAPPTVAAPVAVGPTPGYVPPAISPMAPMPASMAWGTHPNPLATDTAVPRGAFPVSPPPAVAPPTMAQPQPPQPQAAPVAPLAAPANPVAQDTLPPGAPSGQPMNRAQQALLLAQRAAGR